MNNKTKKMIIKYHFYFNIILISLFFPSLFTVITTLSPALHFNNSVLKSETSLIVVLLNLTTTSPFFNFPLLQELLLTDSTTTPLFKSESIFPFKLQPLCLVVLYFFKPLYNLCNFKFRILRILMI